MLQTDINWVLIIHQVKNLTLFAALLTDMDLLPNFLSVEL